MSPYAPQVAVPFSDCERLAQLNLVREDAPSLGEHLSGMLGADVVVLQRIGGGRNSKTYRVDCADGRSFCAKVYFRNPNDLRDRLRCEWMAFEFLRANGVDNVPAPVRADSERAIAVYEFVEGAPAVSDFDVAEVKSAVDFLHRLWKLRQAGESHRLPEASEACFSARDIVGHIERRLGRFSHASHESLKQFLRRSFEPAFSELLARSRRFSARQGLEFDVEIPTAERTLSPSDFGFHNALRRRDHTLIFVDFEYFGWDDPAKMAADFLLHPGMSLAASHRETFLAGFLGKFPSGRRLAQRIELFYPLLGLKWCLILLNEFVPGDLARRRFSGSEVRLHEQLRKAALMLEKARQPLLILT